MRNKRTDSAIYCQAQKGCAPVRRGKREREREGERERAVSFCLYIASRAKGFRSSHLYFCVCSVTVLALEERLKRAYVVHALVAAHSSTLTVSIFIRVVECVRI